MLKFALRLRPRLARWSELRDSLKLLAPAVRENSGRLSGALALGLGAALMELARPWPIKALFDGLLIPQPAAAGGWLAWYATLPAEQAVGAACGALLAIALLWGLCAYGQAWLTARAGQAVVFSLRRRAFNRLQQLPLAFHRRHPRGDLLMRLTGDVQALRDLLVNALLASLSGVLLLLLMTAVLLAMDWRLSLCVLALLPLLALTTVRFSLRIRDSVRKQRREEGRVSALVQESLTGVAYLQASGTGEQVAERFAAANRSSKRAGLRTTRLEATQARIVEILLAAGTASVLWYGVHRALAGHVTPGDLLVFVAYVQTAMRPLRQLARAATRLSKAAACAGRLLEVFATAPAVRDAPGAKSARRLAGRIEFRGVGFAHENGLRALDGVSFVVEPGAMLGVVGPSGAGKSTLLALLLRLHAPGAGRILVDGRDIRRYRVRSLREQMSVVLQETILFAGTIRDNIAWARPGAGDGEVQTAARLANADAFIRALPHGYETQVAEVGATLSGGERQRLAIARAFLRDAPILLLDEPTFGLDAGAEAEVMESVWRLAARRTTFLVAHRLQLVRDANRILVLDQGRVRAADGHANLLGQDAWYAAAWRAQTGGDDLRAGPPAALHWSRHERAG